MAPAVSYVPSFLTLPLLQADLSEGALYESQVYKVVAYPTSVSSITVPGAEILPQSLPVSFLSFPAHSPSPSAQWTVYVPPAQTLSVLLDLRAGTNHLTLRVHGDNYYQIYPLATDGRVQVPCPAWPGGVLTFQLTKEGQCGCAYTNCLYVDPVVRING